jgi:hypothetical protein
MRFDYWQGQEDFLFFKAPRPVLGLTQSSTQRVHCHSVKLTIRIP